MTLPVTKRIPASLSVAPGETFYVQAWFRDTVLPPVGSALTGSLRVTLWP